MGIGALTCASLVNFRTGTQVKKALEDLATTNGSQLGAVVGKSLMLFGFGAVAGCIRSLADGASPYSYDVPDPPRNPQSSKQ
eukprot:1972557-Amphidinium_carterae.1